MDEERQRERWGIQNKRVKVEGEKRDGAEGGIEGERGIRRREKGVTWKKNQNYVCLKISCHVLYKVKALLM